MILVGKCDQGWQLKVFPAGCGGLSLGKVSRWMDTRGETIISEELVHMGGLGNLKASFLSGDVVEQTRSKIC
jgi:hypothetical protein